MQIVFFGDSLTQGMLGVSYVDKVADALRSHQFINKGVNGDTSLNLYRRVERDVIDSKPDGVFIMIGVNDAISRTEPASHSYYRFAKGLRGGQMSPMAFRENMRAIVSKCLAAHLKVWVALPPIEYRPEMVNILREMNESAAEVCRELRVPALNLFAKMVPEHVPARPPLGLSIYSKNLLNLLAGEKRYNQLRDSGGFTYSFDGIHLTEDGARQVALAVIEFLRANGVS